jgi:hypothetical protein
MKLVIPVLTFCGFALGQNDLMPVDEAETMEMSWIDWATEYMPGFKATNKYYQYVNTDLDIKVKYTFQEDKPSFQMDTPWFSESWTVDNRKEEMTKFDWAMEGMGMKGHMNFAQGMDKLTKIKVDKETGEEKTQNKGTHWMQNIDMKMEDKNNDFKMIFQRLISSQLDKKNPDLYVGTEFSEKWQMNQAKAQMKSSHKVKYDNDNMWSGQKTTWDGKMDDGEGTVSASKGEFNVNIDEYTMDENSCDSKMSWNGKDKIHNIEYQGSSEISVMNKMACEFAMKYPQKMMSPHDASKMTETDIKEWLMENTDLNDAEIQAEYEYIMSRTQSLDNGLFEMAEECMVHMKSTYPDMENKGEMVDCEVDFVFRNLLDMSLTWNGQELVKFTNEMVGMDFRYTFYYMGYEAYSMSPMTWYYKVMSDIHEISKEGYLMYKEHEHYQNQIMEVMSMESEEMQMAEIMNHIQFLGNWDYAAGKMKVIFNEIMESMKSEKCGKTLKEHAADYGYYMAEDGEMAMLKQHDMKIQMMEYFEMYNISMFSYMKTKACEFATENFGWEMEKDDDMVMEYPEFVYVEKSKEEMNARIQATCEMMHDEFIKNENEMCDMIVESYINGRDMIVNFADMAVNKINDRTGAETMIDTEFEMVMEKRENEWLEEFNYVWESNMNEEESAMEEM